MIISIKDCWSSVKTEHNAYFDKEVNLQLERYEVGLPRIVRDFLVINHIKIRDGMTEDFKTLQSELDSIVKNKIRGEVWRLLRIIYDYDFFSKKKGGRWCVYKLCEKLQFLTCPYCQLSFNHTLIRNNKGKIRPALDHFFDKANYPLFSISLGNLVPSCHHCNSSLKGGADFFINPHLNPLELKDELLKIHLTADPISVASDISQLDKANISISYDSSTLSKDTELRIKNSLRTFLLEERYQLLIEEVRHLAKNIQTASHSAKTLDLPIGIIMDVIRRGVNESNYKNRIFGKMILDIYDKYHCK